MHYRCVFVFLFCCIGCSSYDGKPPVPPTNPVPVDVKHYQSSQFLVNGEEPAAGTLKINSSKPIRVEGTVTVAPGLGKANFWNGIVGLVRAADNDAGEEIVNYTILRIVEESEPGVLKLAADWTPVAPRGTYELRMTSCPYSKDMIDIPSTTICRSIVEVVE